MCAVPACTVEISQGEATNCRSWQKTGDNVINIEWRYD